MKWNILSPDEVPIHHENFDSPGIAWTFFDKWAERFKEQGHYSTVLDGGRYEIKLDDLPLYCELIQTEEDE